MKLQKYEKYKDSGVEWIGKVPERWGLKKAKWLFKQEKREVKKDDKIITCFRNGQVTLRSNIRTDGFTNALKEHGYQGVRKGDLVIHNMDAFAGAIGISDSNGKSTPVYSVCTAYNRKEIIPYFYALYLRSLAKKGFIESLAKGIRERSTDFRFSDFKELFLPVPPLHEQTKIADFLDQKTAQIDKAISLKEQLIEKLKEYRQILINDAVTKGLDKNVKMKDSGVEWIGEVPEHWKVRRLASLGIFSKGGGISRDKLTKSGKKAILYGDIYTKYNIKTNNFINHISDETAQNAISVFKGDLLLTGSGELREEIGKCIVYLGDEQAYAGGDIIIFKQNKANSLFLSYALNSNFVNTQKSIMAKGEIIVHIYGSKLKNLKVAFPPFHEQTKIANFLDQKTAQIDKAISQQQKQIEKLKEYKASLIDSVVTGKVRVS